MTMAHLSTLTYLATIAITLLPSVSGQYAMPFGGGGCGGCPRPMCNPQPMCQPPMPMCPPPQPCPPQFCPPPPMCPPPPPPMPCPPPPAPACPCMAARPAFYPQYRPTFYAPQSYGGGGGCGGGVAPQPMVYQQQRMPAQNDCCCGCSSPCKYRSRRRFAAFGAKTVDPACNNEKLKNIILENISSDASESKRAIQTAAEEQLEFSVNVICGRGEFSYIAHTEQFCQTAKDDITCYAFKPL